MVNDTHIFRNQTILKAIDCKFYFGRLILTLFFFLIKKKQFSWDIPYLVVQKSHIYLLLCAGQYLIH